MATPALDLQFQAEEPPLPSPRAPVATPRVPLSPRLQSQSTPTEATENSSMQPKTTLVATSQASATTPRAQTPSAEGRLSPPVTSRTPVTPVLQSMALKPNTASIGSSPSLPPGGLSPALALHCAPRVGENGVVAVRLTAQPSRWLGGRGCPTCMSGGHHGEGSPCHQPFQLSGVPREAIHISGDAAPGGPIVIDSVPMQGISPRQDAIHISGGEAPGRPIVVYPNEGVGSRASIYVSGGEVPGAPIHIQEGAYSGSREYVSPRSGYAARPAPSSGGRVRSPDYGIFGRDQYQSKEWLAEQVNTADDVVGHTFAAVPPLSSFYDPSSKSSGPATQLSLEVLRLTVKCARDISDKDGNRDPRDLSITLTLGSTHYYKTSMQRGTLTPFWNECFYFDMQNEDGEGLLEVALYDHGEKAVICRGTLDLYELHGQLSEKGFVEDALELFDGNMTEGILDFAIAGSDRSHLDRPSTKDALRMPDPPQASPKFKAHKKKAFQSASQPEEVKPYIAPDPVRPAFTVPHDYMAVQVISVTDIRGLECALRPPGPLSVRMSLGQRCQRLHAKDLSGMGTFFINLNRDDSNLVVSVLDKHAVAGQAVIDLETWRVMPEEHMIRKVRMTKKGETVAVVELKVEKWPDEDLLSSLTSRGEEETVTTDNMTVTETEDASSYADDIRYARRESGAMESESAVSYIEKSASEASATDVVTVVVHEVKGLNTMPSDGAAMFVSVLSCGIQKDTANIARNPDGIWDEVIEFPNPSTSDGFHEEVVDITVRSCSVDGVKEEALGRASVDLSSVLEERAGRPIQVPLTVQGVAAGTIVLTINSTIAPDASLIEPGTAGRPMIQVTAGSDDGADADDDDSQLRTRLNLRYSPQTDQSRSSFPSASGESRPVSSRLSHIPLTKSSRLSLIPETSQDSYANIPMSFRDGASSYQGDDEERISTVPSKKESHQLYDLKPSSADLEPTKVASKPPPKPQRSASKPPVLPKPGIKSPPTIIRKPKVEARYNKPRHSTVANPTNSWIRKMSSKNGGQAKYNEGKTWMAYGPFIPGGRALATHTTPDPSNRSHSHHTYSR